MRSRIALGPRAGRRVTRLGDLVDEDWASEDGPGQPSRPRCQEYAGFSLHADVSVSGHDRERLERLCRYIARPAIATERLTQCEDGRIAYSLRKRWRDGTTGFLFEPGELIEKLVALIPAPRGHLVRYHGVLAARARWRAEVVRDRRVEAAPDTQERRSLGPVEGDAGWLMPAEKTRELRERRLSWADLMLRVFERGIDCRSPSRSDRPGSHHPPLSSAVRARD